MVLPKDPPTRPRQNGSGGTDSFQLHPTFWLGMVMCDDQGSPNPDGAALTGHPTVPCKPDSDSNIFDSQNPGSHRYFGLGPGQAYEEIQFLPAGLGAVAGRHRGRTTRRISGCRNTIRPPVYQLYPSPDRWLVMEQAPQSAWRLAGISRVRRARSTARAMTGAPMTEGSSQNASGGRRSHSGRCGPLST